MLMNVTTVREQQYENQKNADTITAAAVAVVNCCCCCCCCCCYCYYYYFLLLPPDVSPSGWLSSKHKLTNTNYPGDGVPRPRKSSFPSRRTISYQRSSRQQHPSQSNPLSSSGGGWHQRVRRMRRRVFPDYKIKYGGSPDTKAKDFFSFYLLHEETKGNKKGGEIRNLISSPQQSVMVRSEESHDPSVLGGKGRPAR